MEYGNTAFAPQPQAYSEKELRMSVFKAMCFVALLKLTSGIAMLAFIPIAASVASSPRRKVAAIFSTLMLCTTTTIMSGAVFAHSAAYAIATKAIFLVFSVILTMKAAGRRWPPAMKPVSILMMYLAFQTVASTFGWAPVISELKILLMVMFIMAGANACTLGATGSVDASKIRTIMLTVCCVMMIGSILVYPIPSISRSMQIANAADWLTEDLTESELIDMVLEMEQSLYNGLTGHSQMLGPMCAILNAFLFADYVFNVRKVSRLYMLLMVCAAGLIYMTGSRTAMAAYGFSILVCAHFANGTRKVSSKKKQWLASVVLAIGILGTLAVAVVPSVRERAIGFIMKGRSDTGELDMEEAFSSRQGLIDRSMFFFRQSPLIGNGFQVMWTMKDRKMNGIKSVLSAPIEKGFLPSMILEEGGIIGGALFLTFILSMIASCRKYRYFCFLTCFLTFVVSNMGEATFFSMSGMGGFCWSVCFAAFLLDADRAMRESSAVF